MVQEVERREPQFDFVMLLKQEVFVNREIAVEESRSLDVRPDYVAVLPARRRRKASRVEVLPGMQVFPRIADDRGFGSRESVGAQVVRRLQRGRPRYVQLATCVGLNGRSALRLRDARKYPTVHYAAHELIVFHGAGEVDYIGCVEDVRVIPGQHAIVRAQ